MGACRRVALHLGVIALLAVLGARVAPDPDHADTGEPMAVVFGTYAESAEQVRHVICLAESLREFGGRFRDVPMWLYIPDSASVVSSRDRQRLASLSVTVYLSRCPSEAKWLYYAGKVFAAGEAERRAAAADHAVLVWLDDDTVVLKEPAEFTLPDGISFAYRPVMHNRSGSRYDAPPDIFWQRIYDTLKIDSAKLFPMVTPADHQKIRAYFNAGLLVVRPEAGIFRSWGDDFRRLYSDPGLVLMCRENETKRIFLHQAALVGAVLNTLERSKMQELSDRYNYPMFFQQMFGADHDFDTLDDVVTLRYDVYFREPDPDWADKLSGPKPVIEWLRQHLDRGSESDE
jgi:hypothetical protein